MQNTLNIAGLRRRLAPVLAVLVLLGSLFMPYSAGTRAAAEDTGKYLNADTFIATAAKYLGVPYKLGEKGYKNAYGENLRLYPMSMGDIRSKGLDCSGLFYNALTDLGVSTEGYENNHPVPLSTYSWFHKDGTPYDGWFHINGQRVRPTVVYWGRTNGSRPYYYASNSGWDTIEPGSFVVAQPAAGESSGHCWIYLGEFAGRNEVIDYLVSLGVNRDTANKYVGDGKGDGGNHWRIESTIGTNLGSINKKFKGVMVNNLTNGSSKLGKVGVITVTTASPNNTETTVKGNEFTQIAPMTWQYNENHNYTGTAYGTIDDVSDWWFVRNGIVQLNEYGLEQSNEHYGKVMIQYGRANFAYNDSFSEDEHQTVYYIKNGRVASDYTGAANMSVDVYDNLNHLVPQRSWWRVENGVVNKTYEGVTNNELGWWYFKDGIVQFNYTGIKQNGFGWWRIENGKVNFDANGVYQNECGWWRVENGKFDFNANSIYQNASGWWKTTNGKVTFKENGVYQNSNGWWKVNDSKVDFKFNGIAKNGLGTWFIENGKVNFGYSGQVKYNGKTYVVTEGAARLA